MACDICDQRDTGLYMSTDGGCWQQSGGRPEKDNEFAYIIHKAQPGHRQRSVA